MINNILDSAANELESLGMEAINIIFQDVKEWGIKTISLSRIQRMMHR